MHHRIETTKCANEGRILEALSVHIKMGNKTNQRNIEMTDHAED